MLIKRQVLDDIAAGKITLAFRRWKRPTVRSGGTLRTRIGVLEIRSAEPITERDIRDADARKAGFASRAELIAELRRQRAGQIYRIALRLAGPDPRVALRNDSTLTSEEFAEIGKRLARFDAAGRYGPWTLAVLDLIAMSPGTRAQALSDQLGYEKPWFKAQVRKLKELGLTESLSPGYRLSPRGRVVLRRLTA